MFTKQYSLLTGLKETLKEKDLRGGTSIQAGVTEKVLLGSVNVKIKYRRLTFKSTPQLLYNTVYYNMVLDITRVIADSRSTVSVELCFLCQFSQS